ncbi:head GIN domain-containing protein [Aequorivita sp. SDUM287046]|uniref:Head GIN domain-containing protein n=1 Tax=Aequorivita aurantiaca TaxID=3053356 RepID=A0ABT8DG72_9FLAO|nr:head GIN domain-containing protein [Aequorivita aurantiaca]MDN3724361.1 head GIN domain-containing protein [Aequorivita aurantiaca]
MKNIFYLFFVLALFGCNSENGWDCIQTAGKTVQQEMPIQPFQKIIVWERIKLFVKQGEEHKVMVQTGENLMSDIEVSVANGVLQIHNNNACNLVRDYGLTHVYITTPNLTEIRSSTGLAVESIGVLGFPNLILASEDQHNEDQYHIDGDFKLNLNVENLTIVANGLSKFYLSGSATNANFGLYASDCRIYSENLIVQNLNVYHRSTGPIVVNPQESIRGQIVSLGNVICKNRPPIVEVEVLYSGQLIFE